MKNCKECEKLNKSHVNNSNGKLVICDKCSTELDDLLEKSSLL